ncbi:MAG: signal peptidase II [Betaproteobacteria bacterium]|nr:signal peptidase II [Betaproteobacteria bacterium]
MESKLQPQRTGRLIMFGYILLFLAMVGLDQTTKYHAQRQYMTWSHETDLRSYRGDSYRVMTWGVSPSLATEKGMERSTMSANWVDFHLTYVRNPGAAWGSFANTPEHIRLWLFYTVTVFVSGMILYLFRSSHPGQRLARTSLVLVLSGAAGNFIDRVLLKYVIDFLHFHWKIFGWEYSFPVFNWADVAINVGIALMLIDMLLQEVSLRRGAKQVALQQPSAAP